VRRAQLRRRAGPGAHRGRRANFERNGYSAEFTQACVGATAERAVRFRCESDGVKREIEQISVDAFVAARGLEHIDVLHSDIQGAETAMFEGARKTRAAGAIRFVFVSTHHHSISGDPLTHQRCLEQLRAAGARILVEHSIAESFSGDGLIVASFDPRDADLADLYISRSRASHNIFREIEYDLVEAWKENAKLRKRLPRERLARLLGRHPRT
jgi:hypothetical protein